MSASVLANVAIETSFAESLGSPAVELLRAGGPPFAELASNENPLGPSPRVREAIDRSCARMARYPDPSGYELRRILAHKHGIGLQSVILGNGSSEILDLIARAFLSRDTSAVCSQYAFIVYPIVTKAAGARIIQAEAKDFGNDPLALLSAIEGDTRVLFIANPNNPTGTLLDSEELHEFVRRVPRNVLVVLDEAYYEYAPAGRVASSVAWLDEFPNLIVTRTFSKAYGLAGLRIGYGLAQPGVVDALNRMRQPFNVNTFAQQAAIAALDDVEHLATSVTANQCGIRQLEKGLMHHGIDFIPSCANFIAFRVGDAARIHRELLGQGILVRELDNYGMPDYLRVSVGRDDENQRLLAALAKLLPESGGES